MGRKAKARDKRHRKLKAIRKQRKANDPQPSSRRAEVADRRRDFRWNLVARQYQLAMLQFST